MTEIPEHLLQRSRERRDALGLGGDAPATPVTAAPSSDSAPVAAAAASAPVKAAPAPAPVKVVAPPPPHVEAALRRKKVPLWAMPVLLGLPIWAYTYVGTLEDPPVEAAGLLAEGEESYATGTGALGCAGCHGANGGGGVGPAFAGGAIVETFSDPIDHLEWVIKGSANWGQPTYGDTAKPVGGGGVMPGFAGDAAPAEQVLAVVMYERAEFGGDPAQEELILALDAALASGELELPEEWSTDVTSEELHTLLDPFLSPEG